MVREALTREQVIKVIERSGCDKIPVVFHKWWGPDLPAKYGAALFDMVSNYPDDINCVWYLEPGYEGSSNSNPNYRLGYRDNYDDFERHSIGNAVVLLPDWSELDSFLENFPNPNEPGNFDNVIQTAKTPDGRYKLGCWWRLFHERLWTIRGMENLMYDYYDNMEGLKLICNKIVEYYKVIIDKYKEAGCDGIFTSDDLGHQHGPMMSPAIFEELYLPYYKEIIAYTHEKGMHFFLHSCGDNTLLMSYLIEAGLDVFHPVQKGCMDMAKTAQLFGDKITFLAGVDVQNLLPNGSIQEIHEEIANMKKIFGKPSGGLLLAMGNGILSDNSLENIQAALDEMCL